MLFELRLYHAAPGVMERLHVRYRGRLPGVFERHGIRCAGIWTAISGPALPLFVYCLAFRDMGERERLWASFYQDPEWWQIREETNGGVELVDYFESLFLSPRQTGGHELKSIEDLGPDCVRAQLPDLFDLVVFSVGIGQVERAGSMLSHLYIPKLTSAGGQPFLTCDIVTGRAVPAIAVIVRWPDESVRRKGWKAVADDQQIQTALREQQEKFGRPALGRVDITELEPAPYFAFPQLAR